MVSAVRMPTATVETASTRRPTGRRAPGVRSAPRATASTASAATLRVACLVSPAIRPAPLAPAPSSVQVPTRPMTAAPAESAMVETLASTLLRVSICSMSALSLSSQHAASMVCVMVAALASSGTPQRSVCPKAALTTHRRTLITATAQEAASTVPLPSAVRTSALERLVVAHVLLILSVVPATTVRPMHAWPRSPMARHVRLATSAPLATVWTGTAATRHATCRASLVRLLVPLVLAQRTP